MRLCPECGAENRDDAQFCVNCGVPLPSAEEATTQEAPAPPESYLAPPPVNTPPGLPVPPPPMHAGSLPPGMIVQQRSQLGLWAFLFGLASFICCCGFLAPVAIVLGVQARKDPTADQGLAITGIVLGIITAVLFIVFVLISILIAIAAESESTALLINPRLFA